MFFVGLSVPILIASVFNEFTGAHSVKQVCSNGKVLFTYCPNVIYTSFTTFSMKYLVMCIVYTDDGGIK